MFKPLPTCLLLWLIEQASSAPLVDNWQKTKEAEGSTFNAKEQNPSKITLDLPKSD